jgi:hypothetical protein
VYHIESETAISGKRSHSSVTLPRIVLICDLRFAIAWLLHQENVIVIPKSRRIDHIEENYAAKK